MKTKDLQKAICTMVQGISDKDALMRIYRMVSYLIRRGTDN